MTSDMAIGEARRRAKRGPAILMARRVFSLALTLISTIWIARLLSPKDYGLANMAFVLLSFGQVFRDFGLTNALLRKGFMSQEEISSVFWLNVAFTSAITIAMALSSGYVAEFYNEPIVKYIILISLVGFLLEGYSLQHRALIHREMRFATLAIIEVAGLILGFAATLILAIVYKNYWALVIGQLAQSVVTAGLFTTFSRWWPSAPKRIKGLRDLLGFGANTSIFSICTFVSNNVAAIMIGRVLGTPELGQYNRAQALYQMPVSNVVLPITQATMPLLLRLRARPRGYRAAYLRLVRGVCTLLFPLAAIMVFASEPLVIFLIGEKWEQAGKVLAALAPALAAVGVGYAASDLFITQDRSRELRWLGLSEAALRIGAIYVGVRFGLLGGALAFSLSTIAAVLLRIFVAGRRGPVSFVDQIRAAAPGTMLAVLVVIPSAVVTQIISDTASGVGSLGIYIATAAAGGILGIYLCIPARKALVDSAQLFGIRLKRRRKRNSPEG